MSKKPPHPVDETVPSWIGAVLPFRGECGICGGPDARHRELDAIAGRVRAGDGVDDVADDYGRPRWFVDRLAREWHIQEPDPDPTPVPVPQPRVLPELPSTASPVCFRLSLLPEDSENYLLFDITVSWAGGDLWEIRRSNGRCFGADHKWDWGTPPSSRTEAWLAEHRFDLETALRLADAELPNIVVNGLTAAKYRTRTEAVIEDTETPPPILVGDTVEHVDLGRCKVVALGSALPDSGDPDMAYVDFGHAPDGEPTETWVPLTDLRHEESSDGR